MLVTLRVTSSYVFKYLMGSGVIDRGSGVRTAHWQNECKNRAPVRLYFGFNVLLIFSSLFLFCVFGVFSCDLGF